jgi:ketosteroid isomerase-like protein
MLHNQGNVEAPFRKQTRFRSIRMKIRRRVMHPCLRALCTVGLAVLIPTSVSLGTQSQSQGREQEVKDLEQRWLENEDRPDVLESILADDFVHVLPSGFISKADHIGYLRQHPNYLSGKKHFEELRVRVYGDVAIATGIVNSVREQGSKPKRTAFTDVFVRRDGKWLAVNAQELLLVEPESKPAP